MNTCTTPIWLVKANVVAAGAALVLVGCADRDDEYTRAEHYESPTEPAMVEPQSPDEPGGIRSQHSPSDSVSPEQQFRFRENEDGPMYQTGRSGFGPTSDLDAAEDYGMTSPTPEGASEVEQISAEAREPDVEEAQAILAESSEMEEADNLESLVAERLRNGEFDISKEEMAQIEIQVEDDTVTLSGTAPSYEAIAQIVAEISRIEQVAHVENNLTTR